MAKAEWLPALFAEQPARATLAKLVPSWPLQRVSVRVHRNIACELVTTVAAPYLAFGDLSVDWRFGDYDDSLAFAEAGDTDADLVWIDFARFRATDSRELADWFAARIAVLRESVRGPVLITTDTRSAPDSDAINGALIRLAERLPGIHVCDFAPIQERLGTGFFDARNAQLMGLPYSNGASLLLARQLGCRWLPGALRSRLKAIVVDLDNTLYDGVLAEDGPAGIRLGDAHARLQQQLLAYREQGVFLAVCSKNEPDDVVALFDARADFPLRAEHLSASAVGWGGKSTGLRRIADQLRIALDAVLYIDDNPGELAAVASEAPGLKLLHAGPDANVTIAALHDFPGLHNWRDDTADRLRIGDLAAASAREREAANAPDQRGYLSSLQLRVRFRVDRASDLARLHSLSNKTNQFNLRLRRMQSTEVADYIAAPDAHAVAIELADRLSDSGVIGAVFFRSTDDEVHVEEVCISCRALGRGLDDMLVLGAVRAARAVSPVSVSFDHATGPRNGPARRWLESLTDEGLQEPEGRVTLPWRACAERLERLDDLVDVSVSAGA